MKPNILVHLLLHSLVAILSATADHGGDGTSSILFNTLERLDYAFDIFSLPITDEPATERWLRMV